MVPSHLHSKDFIKCLVHCFPTAPFANNFSKTSIPTRWINLDVSKLSLVSSIHAFSQPHFVHNWEYWSPKTNIVLILIYISMFINIHILEAWADVKRSKAFPWHLKTFYNFFRSLNDVTKHRINAGVLKSHEKCLKLTSIID